MRFTAGVILVLGHFLYFVATRVPCHAGDISPTGCIFPFRLSGQPVMPISFFIEFFDKSLHVLLTNFLHWTIVTTFEIQIWWICAHYRTPLRLRNRVPAKVEVNERYFVNRGATILEIAVLVSHLKDASFDADHEVMEGIEFAASGFCSLFFLQHIHFPLLDKHPQSFDCIIPRFVSVIPEGNWFGVFGQCLELG